MRDAKVTGRQADRRQHVDIIRARGERPHCLRWHQQIGCKPITPSLDGSVGFAAGVVANSVFVRQSPMAKFVRDRKALACRRVGTADEDLASQRSKV
jgi:hypothetical protein